MGSVLFAMEQSGLLRNFKDIYAVDISPERIQRLSSILPKVKAFVGDATESSSYMVDQVDFVVCNQVIEHVNDDLKLLGEIFKILKKDGLAYLTTVFKKWYGWYFYKNSEGKWVIDPTHVREYTKDDELLEKVKQTGFNIIDSRKTLFWFPITDFILKRIGFGNDIYLKRKFIKKLRSIKVPIIGYYNWVLFLKKP